MGEFHRVFVKNGQLGFASHSVTDLRMLDQMGEECGCLKVWRAFHRRAGLERIRSEWIRLARERQELGWARSEAKRKSPVDPLEIPIEWRMTEHVMQAIANSMSDGLEIGGVCENVQVQPCEALEPWGDFWAWHRGKSVVLDTWRSAKRGPYSARSVKVWLGWRWYTDVFKRTGGHVRTDGRTFQLGWDGDKPLVLWLPTGVARLDGSERVPVLSAAPWAEVLVEDLQTAKTAESPRR